MALTDSQKMAVFLLLSSRSQFRFDLERRTAGTAGTADPFPDAASFAAQLKTSLGGLGIGIAQADLDAIDENSQIASVWVGPRHKAGVPDRNVANVTTDHNEIVLALGMPPLYTEDNPCPDGPRGIKVAQAVAALNL